jgi:undecaprenyl-diphosphatase
MGEKSKGLLARRLARDQTFGLHLTLGLVACLALLGLFFLLAGQVQGTEPPSLDSRVYDHLRDSRETSAHLRVLFERITDLGGFRLLLILSVVAAALLIVRRRWWLAIAFLVVVLLGQRLNDVVKHAYHRQRPLLHADSIHEPSYSFPSGHSMESMIAYGMLAYLALLAAPPRRWLRAGVVASFGLLVLAIGFSRMYLSAHWLTDVLGGFTLGAAWLALSIGLIECGRRRGAQTTSPASAALVDAADLPRV